MSLNQLFFQQFDTCTEPKKAEIFASQNLTHPWGSAKLWVIGSSHHLSLGSRYSERLSCATNLPNQLGDGPHIFTKTTASGLVKTTIWQEQSPAKEFFAREKAHLAEAWDLVHCFHEGSAFTGIRLSADEIFTIHTYPENLSLVFTRTKLP